MPNQNPEQIARDPIDKQLMACGWIIQGIKQVNLYVGIGVAVKEFRTDVGPAVRGLLIEVAFSAVLVHNKPIKKTNNNLDQIKYF